MSLLSTFTEEGRGIITSVNLGASAISLLSSGFIVISYIFFKELHKFSFKLVFYLALSDLFCSFFSVVGDPTRSFSCNAYAQGYSTHFFCIASFLWTTTIAFTLHRTVVRHKTDVEDLEPLFHLYVWGTSLFMTVARSIGDNPAQLGGLCLTQGGRKATAIHLLTFYAPLWIVVFFNGFTYLQVTRMLNNATRMAAGMSDRIFQIEMKADIKALNRWGYYPLILIGSWAFGTINHIHDFISPGHKLLWLSVLDVGMASLMGFFNSIAYGLNASLKRAIYERLEFICPQRFQSWLPNNWKRRDEQQHDNELVSLKIQDPP